MISSSSFSRRLVLCLCSAALVCLSFPNYFDKSLTPPTAVLGWVALIPLFLALRGATPKQGAFLGFAFGFFQFGGVLYWIAFLEEAKYLSGLAWLTLVTYLSLYSMAFGWIYCFLLERFRIAGLWFAPVVWVACEYFRGTRPWGGFNWAEIGYTQAPYPVILAFTALAGIYGLNFLMVWFNAAVAEYIGELRKKKKEGGGIVFWEKWVGLLTPTVPVLVVCAYGLYVIQTTPVKKVGKVALIQPSIDQSLKWDKTNEEATYHKFSRLITSAKNGHPDLVIWPETAAPSYLLWSPKALNRVTTIVRSSLATNLVGCLDAQKGKDNVVRYFNAAVQFTAQGRSNGIYHKRHLVPFGEFVPFQKYLTFLGPVVGDLGNFDFGSSYEKFQTRKFSYTPMICYEVIFPGDVRSAFQTQADCLVNISNDAWYGRTASAYQHVMMAVVRTAEERKPLLRAANTGISLATDPFGHILTFSRLFEETELTADVILSTGKPTLFSRWGNWLPLSCWGITFVFFIWGWSKPVEEPLLDLPPSKVESGQTP